MQKRNRSRKSKSGVSKPTMKDGTTSTRRPFAIISHNDLKRLMCQKDFRTLTLLGRVINALTSSFYLIEDLNPNNLAFESARKSRSYHFSFQIMASYLCEAIATLEKIANDGEYGQEASFDCLRTLLSSDKLGTTEIEINGIKEAIKIIRDNTGFHLDNENKVFPKAITELKENSYVLFSADSTPENNEIFRRSLNFDFSNELDLKYCLSCIRKKLEISDDVSDRDILTRYFFKGPLELLRKLQYVSQKISIELMEKLGIDPFEQSLDRLSGSL